MSFDREILEIKNFDYGTIKRADPLDIPLAAASDSNNIDGDAPYGRLEGIPNAIEYKSSARGFDARRSAWIIGSDGKWNLVYTNGSAIKVITDFYGSFADSGLSVAYNGYSFVAHNQECHIACGQTNESQWIGYCNYTQLGGSVVGWAAENTEIPQVVTASTTGVAVVNISGSGTGVFDTNTTYIYKCSMVYDYTQESPLDAWGYIGLSGDYATMDVQITIINALSTAPSKRLTGCKLYRAELNNSTLQISLFRLIKTFDITGALAHTGYTWAAVATPVSGLGLTWDDDNSIVGATYEQETGIAETLTSNSMKYTLNCEANGSMFVTGCSKTEIADASHMVFKSQSYRYDMFNWSAIGSFLRLPTQPTALVTFNNRVWAFDEENTYRIDPNNMIVEEIIFGVGCISQRSILVTPYGMYWCDESNAYWHDGQTLNPIGNSIKEDNPPWHGFPTSYGSDRQESRPIVVYSPVKMSILFIVPYSIGGGSLYDGLGMVDDHLDILVDDTGAFLTDDTVSNVWAWHVTKKRWDSWGTFTPNCGGPFGAFTGKDGEIYVADGISKLYNAMGGTSKRHWNWISKDIDFDSLQYKKYYYLRSRNTSVTASPAFNYGLDGNTLTGTFTNNKFNNGNWPKSRTLKLSIDDANSNTVDAMEVVFRRIDGSR